jgi:hypothetical protein
MCIVGHESIRTEFQEIVRISMFYMLLFIYILCKTIYFAGIIRYNFVDTKEDNPLAQLFSAILSISLL